MTPATVGLTITDDNRIACITLQRPAAANAMDHQFFKDFHNVLDTLETLTPSPRVLILTGQENAFCAGADLVTTITSFPEDLKTHLDKDYIPLFRRLKHIHMPSLAAVNGVAAGAGMALALACDITIAARSAYFKTGFIDVGLIPDCGMTHTLPRTIGRARAMATFMLNTEITAQEAVEIGLIYKTVPNGQLDTSAHQLAETLASGPTRSYVAIRQLVDAADKHNFDEQMKIEAKAQQTAGYHEDFAEGLTAFHEKRKPVFNGI
ncbi:MAG: 2-(1,2-epoxy-1,2-dihydrophenyl)acetyl-CoA isomerase [Kordiimonas sp.]|nr:2-(1,2-epoxy-1,2-dihydrophenyl)acetyl-CoA isomerase [Kordiimonas sp.]